MHGNCGNDFPFTAEHRHGYCNRIVEQLGVVGANSGLAHFFELKLKRFETGYGLGCETLIRLVAQGAFRVADAHLAQEQFAACGAVKRYSGSRFQVQPERMAGFDPVDVEDLVSFKQGQVAALAAFRYGVFQRSMPLHPQSVAAPHVDAKGDQSRSRHIALAGRLPKQQISFP